MGKIHVLCAWVIVSVALACISCADTTPLYYTTTFNKTKAEQMLRPGRNTIIVKAFTTDLGTDLIHSCAGETTTLMPATERAAEYITFLFGSEKGGQTYTYTAGNITARIQNNDPDFTKFTVAQDCTSKNHVVFHKVADGEFYILSISYERLYARKIRMKGGETKEVIFRGDMAHITDLFDI